MPVALLPDRVFNIRSLVPKKDLLLWVKTYKKHHDFWSIPDTAKRLGINHEFAYQLVNLQLLTYFTKENSQTRWIGQYDLEKFESQYILLAKLASSLNIDSRKLQASLSLEKVFPIAHCWSIKLRQKVYLRIQLEEIDFLQSLFIDKRD